MLEQILTKESVNEECRLSASSSGQQTPCDEDGRSLSTASFRTHKSSSSSQNSTPSTPIAVMTGFVHKTKFHSLLLYFITLWFVECRLSFDVAPFKMGTRLHDAPTTLVCCWLLEIKWWMSSCRLWAHLRCRQRNMQIVSFCQRRERETVQEAVSFSRWVYCGWLFITFSQTARVPLWYICGVPRSDFIKRQLGFWCVSTRLLLGILIGTGSNPKPVRDYRGD